MTRKLCCFNQIGIHVFIYLFGRMDVLYSTLIDHSAGGRGYINRTNICKNATTEIKVRFFFTSKDTLDSFVIRNAQKKDTYCHANGFLDK